MSELKAGIISQARMTSTRLPGKVLLPINGKTVLQYHTDRLLASTIPLYIATTTNRTDDPIEAFGHEQNILVYRGNEENVLSRYYECGKKFELDIIIRVTSDCPLIDGNLIRESVAQYIAYQNQHIYLSNCLHRTYPRGFDFEIFSFDLLTQAFQNAHLPADLEHVTPYINQNKIGNVILKHIIQPEDKSQYRLTLDTPDDFKLLELLIQKYQAHEMTYAEIIQLMDAHPELAAMNAHVEQKPTYKK